MQVPEGPPGPPGPHGVTGKIPLLFLMPCYYTKVECTDEGLNISTENTIENFTPALLELSFGTVTKSDSISLTKKKCMG